MKMWRKLAMEQGKQDGRRPGKAIKRQMVVEEQMFKELPRITPVLAALFTNVGLPVPKPKMFLDDVEKQDPQSTAWGDGR